MTDSRFISFFQRTLAFKGKHFATVAGTIFGAILALAALNTFTSLYKYHQKDYNRFGDSITVVQPYIDPLWESEYVVGIIFMVVVGAFAASKFYSDFSTKEMRLEALTLPVPAHTRFITSFIFYIIAPILITVLSIFIADGLRVGILRCFYDFGELAQPMPLRVFFTFDTDCSLTGNDLLFCAVIYSIIIVGQAFYTAGSIYFTNKPFVKTTASLWVLGTVITLLIYLGYLCFFDHASVDTKPFMKAGTGSAILIAVCSVAFAAILYGLSYWRLKETDSVGSW